MTASTQIRTTIGQLVYRTAPRLDLLRLAEDLDAALVGADAGRLRIVEERGDVAVVDVGASRVAVAMMTGLDSRGGAAVVVTVGYGPGGVGDASLARRQSVLSRLIVERIAARFQPQETLWSTDAEVATPELFDRLRTELSARRQAQIEAQAERARARRPAPLRAIDPAEVSRMFQKFEQNLAAARADRSERGRPDEGSAREPASPTAEGAARPSAPLRLAAHLLDATVMVIALPVGAAMMIYGLTRGPDVNTSARALAMCGTGVGMIQLAGGIGALQGYLL